MSLVSICPACHHENLVSNTTCDACEANLGAFVFETDLRSRSRFMFFAIGLTLAFYILLVVFGLASLVLVAPFYAALIVSYASPTNVVSEATWGAFIGVVGGSLFVLLFKDGVAKAIGAVISGKPDNWVIGFFFALLLIYPFCVLGAAAGETLSARRRKPERTPVAPTEDIK